MGYSFFLNFIGVELIYTVVLVSSVQHSDSVIHIHVFILFQIRFPYRLWWVILTWLAITSVTVWLSLAVPLKERLPGILLPPAPTHLASRTYWQRLDCDYECGLCLQHRKYAEMEKKHETFEKNY